jgi:hypothetical protein
MTAMWHLQERLRDLCQTAEGVLPGSSITTTIQHTNTHITYTPNTHITQNNTTKQTKRKNKSAQKATQTVKDILQLMNTA